MSLPAIFMETPAEVEQGLRNGSTIYDRECGDTRGEFRFDKYKNLFVYEFYGECARYRNPRQVKWGESACAVWNHPPRTFEFTSLLDMACWYAFGGKEWT